MKQLKVTLKITLNEDAINELIKEREYPKEHFINLVKAHIESAVGNKHILGYGYIEESEIEEIKEV